MEDHEEMMGSQLDDEKAQRRFNEIIERIEQVRGYLGLNRSKFCRTIGMSPQTYNNFIGPQGTKPNIQLLHGVVTRYIIHDAVAQEVDSDTFFHTRESGGTVISSAYELCQKIIDEEYPQELWNVYVFHFSDGDNWSGGDTDRCINLLKSDLLPKVNLFGYGQVESTYGSGQFIRELENNIQDIDNLVLSRIENKDDIYQSIKDFLGKGK